jgi:diguanylate cyclase (GGDEF)-like protein
MQSSFRLTRYFSALSFALIVVAGLLLAWTARNQASQQMRSMAQTHNEALGQVFINSLWNQFDPAVRAAKGKSADALRKQADDLLLHASTAALMKESNIIKVKVYSLDGRTVYSSDVRQIGEEKSANAGFMSAKQGSTASELTHRNQFDSFEGSLAEVDVVSSYLPVRVQGSIVGVMELYQDVTPFVLQLDQVMIDVLVNGALVMLSLYGMQLLVVRYAQQVLNRQQDKLLEANRELDQRVAERTRDLQDAMSKLQDEVGERVKAETRLEHLAHHDPLTSLPNRLMFNQHLQRCIARAQRKHQRLAVLFIDLDRFKEINDTMGHTVGDELLIEIAQRLTGHLRSGDMLARLGGDEFVCAFEDVSREEEVSHIAGKLIARVSAPISLRSHSISISASVGIALFPEDGEDTENLLRAADTAMYQAKKDGRNTYHFYTAEMTQHARERVQLDTLLRGAIAKHELHLHYQVKVDLNDPSHPSGVEALARWTNPVLGPVPPVRFIPVAEETGFIVALGKWVLHSACMQMVQWRAQGLHIPKISVNLSVRQLERPEVVEMVQGALEASALPADALELEITESVIMHAQNAFLALERLSVLGVRLSVDDFGTGYSSLAYLKLLPIDVLKIDRSFVTGIGDSRGDESIIRAVIGMAKSLHLDTVAEGVETQAQLEFLKREGCQQAQGYLLGKPQSAEEFSATWAHLARPHPEDGTKTQSN